MLTVERAQRLFRQYNRAYFEDSLPTPEIQIVRTLRAEDGDRANGATFKSETGSFVIQLDGSLNNHMLCLTLAHEMVHVKIWPSSHRTKAWKAEIARLGSLGFLAEVI